MTVFAAAATDAAPAALLAEHGSPLWIADVDRVRERARGFRAAWRAAWPDVGVAYSYKANRLLRFLHALEAEDVQPEVVCAAEYALARDVVEADGPSIVVNGPAKPDALLERAAADGALVIVDSGAELERVARAGVRRVGIRVSVPGFRGAPSRFGIAPAETPAAAARALELGLFLEALSAHVVSIDFDSSASGKGAGPAPGGVPRAALGWPGSPERHVEAALTLARLARELERTGVSVATLDLGGGFPPAPAVSEHAGAVARALRAEGYAGRVQLEPGRAIVQDAVELVCTVVAVKALADGRRSVGVDAGTNLLPGAALAWPAIEVAATPPAAGWFTSPAAVCGPLCLNVDVLHPRAELPPVEPGDQLVVRDVGAYHEAASTQFGEPRPAIVARDGGRTVACRRRERVEDLIRLELEAGRA